MTEQAHSAPDKRDLTRIFYGLSRGGSGAATARLLGDFRRLATTLFFSDTPGSDWNRGALLAMVLQTRDLAGGKGEYGLFYLLMGELFLIDHHSRPPPQLSAPGGAADEESHGVCQLGDVLVQMMASLVQNVPTTKSEDTPHPEILRPTRPWRPYGSWKDFRAVLSHLREMVGEDLLSRTRFFKGCVRLVVDQLHRDQCTLESGAEKPAPITLVGKWIPRERSKKHGWLVKYLARALWDLQESISGDDDDSVCSETAGRSKTCRGVRPAQFAHYRKIVSALNRHLRTPEVAQCEGRWAAIDFARDVPALTLRRQRRAFQYPEWESAKSEDLRTQDRLECRRNYLEHLRDCAQGVAKVKAGAVSPRSLVRDAIAVTESDTYEPREAAVAASAIDLQWWESRKPLADDGARTQPIVPIVDTSCTMSMDSDDPLCAAIGIGLRLADCSSLGRRLITFSSTPVWVNLEEQDTLTTAVREIRAVSAAGGEADIVGAFELVANACAEADLHPNVVKGLCIVLLSDADDGAWSPPTVLHERIVALFRDAGHRSSHGEPYRAPHIVYWGLRTRQPLPCSTGTPGVSMVSGYSPLLELGLRTTGLPCLGDLAPSPESAMVKALTRQGRYAWVWCAAEKIQNPRSSGRWIW